MDGKLSGSGRRSFIAGAGAILASIAGPKIASAAPLWATDDPEPAEPWLRGLNGEHRQFFDINASRNGVPLSRALNFYDAYREAYGLQPADLSVLLGCHGPASSFVLNDAMYAKYELGKKYDAIDPLTKRPATRNPFVKKLDGYDWRSDFSVEAHQARGARFLWCNKSLGGLAIELAAGKRDDEAAIAAELRANVLPGVTIVPAMIVAANRAQEIGCAYTSIA